MPHIVSIDGQRSVPVLSITLVADAKGVPCTTVQVASDGGVRISVGPDGDIVADTISPAGSFNDPVLVLLGRTLYGCAWALSEAEGACAGDAVSVALIPVIRENLIGWLDRPMCGNPAKTLAQAWAGCIVSDCVIDEGRVWIPVSAGGAA